MALSAGVAVTVAAPASAGKPPQPDGLAGQVRAADALRAQLNKSNAEVAAANARLEALSAQSNALLANLSTARTEQVAAETEAATQRSRLVELGRQVQEARGALGQLASDSYITGGGPLGDVAAVLEALTAPSPSQSADSLATVHYLVNSHARLLSRLKSVRAAQATTWAKATAASNKAAAAARSAAMSKSALDAVINDQRSALNGLQAAEAAQVRRAAGLRGSLLRSEDPLARAADKKLALALQGQDYTLLMRQSASCGKGSATYPNGWWPASALCGLYAAPGQRLRRSAALAFNAMSSAYQRQTGSALCVTEGYRSYAEQVAVKRKLPTLAATPGRSQHGLGLAVDLCGGVQSFTNPAHLWMTHNAALYGWFHPAWAEPTGGLPEPWHWEFAS
jgi:LAS superfamily LD-carboxypeptidase LdcB